MRLIGDLEAAGVPTLYASGEESPEQIRLRAERLEEPTAGVSHLARGYDVGVLSVDRERVLAPTA